MKKAVILFIIFIMILGAGIAEHFFVHKTFDAFNERIGKIEAALQNDDVDSALSYAEDLQNFWAKKTKTRGGDFLLSGRTTGQRNTWGTHGKFKVRRH